MYEVSQDKDLRQLDKRAENDRLSNLVRSLGKPP